MKTLILFDGSNFYNFSRKLVPGIHLTNFKYRVFSEEIADEIDLDITYFIGEVRFSNSPKAKRLYSSQQRLFEKLVEQNVSIKLGYLLKGKDKYYEKGVDVQIAVDMVKGALKDEYNKFYLISSDSDLLPAVKVALGEKKEVVYVGFQGNLSQALLQIVLLGL